MTVIVLDNFTGGSSGDDLDTHTPDTDVEGGGWVVEPANGFELTGSGEILANTLFDECRIDAGITDQLVTVNADDNSATATYRVSLRRDNSAFASRNCYEVVWRQEASADTLRILELTAGSQTEIADTQVAFHDNTAAHELVCEIRGSSITVTVDGTERLTATDSTHTTGNYTGLVVGVPASTRWTSFQVEDIVVPSLLTQQSNNQAGF